MTTEQPKRTDNKQATIRKLLEITDDAETSQYQTYLATIAAKGKLSPAEMRDFQRLKRQLAASLSGSSDTFRNIMDVLYHLQAQGYKISKPKIYRDRDAHEINESPDGSYTMAEVLRYAAGLKRLGGRSASSVALEKMQEDRLTQETRRIRNMANLSELKTKLLEGRYIPRESSEMELAARATQLKSEIMNFPYEMLPELCRRLSGDPTRLPDCMEFCRTWLAERLDRYSQRRRYKVKIDLSTLAADKLRDEADDIETDGIEVDHG
jgi:hypothetical protein